MGIIGRAIDRIFGDNPEEETRYIIDRNCDDIKYRLDKERMDARIKELQSEIDYWNGYIAAMAENRRTVDEPMEELEVVE